MVRKKVSSAYENVPLPLANELQSKVKQWSDTGYPRVHGREITHITRELLNYWFNQDESPFYLCQREAIETLIYCFEILRNPNLQALYQLLAPQDLIDNIHLKKIENSSFPKYCLKMATGTGKTWVLALALIWQFFNALESPDFCKNFLVVAPIFLIGWQLERVKFFLLYFSIRVCIGRASIHFSQKSPTNYIKKENNTRFITFNYDF